MIKLQSQINLRTNQLIARGPSYCENCGLKNHAKCKSGKKSIAVGYTKSSEYRFCQIVHKNKHKCSHCRVISIMCGPLSVQNATDHKLFTYTASVSIKTIFAILFRSPNHRSENILFPAVLLISAQSLLRFVQLFSQNKR